MLQRRGSITHGRAVTGVLTSRHSFGPPQPCSKDPTGNNAVAVEPPRNFRSASWVHLTTTKEAPSERAGRNW